MKVGPDTLRQQRPALSNRSLEDQYAYSWNIKASADREAFWTGCRHLAAKVVAGWQHNRGLSVRLWGRSGLLHRKLGGAKRANVPVVPRSGASC